ncbi:DUF1573 domain-containing protein [Paludisphaera rhizosphaerae]|uniref:DUF1573 domain-containing protein n=1 Tax=Paludisphaera rhizosphaerae TaxID=2711216 RepID=UPI0013EBDE09
MRDKRREIQRSLTTAVALALAGCASQIDPPKVIRYDAGYVFAGETKQVTHVFKVSNNLSRQLTILKETHSCSCTNVEIDKKIIPPKSEASVVVRVNVPYNYGTTSVACSVETDHPSQPKQSFEMRFTTYTRLRVVPDKLDMGNLDYNEREDGSSGANESSRVASRTSRQCLAEVYSRDSEEEMKPTLISRSTILSVDVGECFDSERFPSGVIRRRYPVTVEFSKHGNSEALRSRSETMTLRIADALPAVITVQWRTAPPYRVLPSSIYFGLIDRGAQDPIFVDIEVASTQNRPFRVTSVTTGSTFVRAVSDLSASSEARETHRLRFQVNPATVEKSVTGSVAVETDNMHSPIIHIPWSLFLRRDG